MSPHYPAAYNLDNIVSVAATDSSDAYAYFSNYGATTVDLAAPGDFIYSTVPGWDFWPDNYDYYQRHEHGHPARHGRRRPGLDARPRRHAGPGQGRPDAGRRSAGGYGLPSHRHQRPAQRPPHPGPDQGPGQSAADDRLTDGQPEPGPVGLAPDPDGRLGRRPRRHGRQREVLPRVQRRHRPPDRQRRRPPARHRRRRPVPGERQHDRPGGRHLHLLRHRHRQPGRHQRRAVGHEHGHQAARVVDQSPHGDRGQQRDADDPLPVAALGRQQPAGVGPLRHDRRHGDRRQRLPGHLRHAHLRPRRGQQDDRRHRPGRHPLRGRRDLPRQPEQRDGRRHHQAPGPGDDPQRRRAAEPDDRRRQRPGAQRRLPGRRVQPHALGRVGPAGDRQLRHRERHRRRRERLPGRRRLDHHPGRRAGRRRSTSRSSATRRRSRTRRSS